MKFDISQYLSAIIQRQSGDNFKLSVELFEKLSKESKLSLIRILENLEIKKKKENNFLRPDVP
jgi:hypothetical protein